MVCEIFASHNIVVEDSLAGGTCEDPDNFSAILLKVVCDRFFGVLEALGEDFGTVVFFNTTYKVCITTAGSGFLSKRLY